MEIQCYAILSGTNTNTHIMKMWICITTAAIYPKSTKKLIAWLLLRTDFSGLLRLIPKSTMADNRRIRRATHDLQQAYRNSHDNQPS